jgi:hypothetical protein
MADKKKHEPETHRDPITHEPGAHPVGTGLGAASAGAAGAAIGGVIGGPIGAAVGAAAGAIAGGLAGHGAAESVNPTAEDEFWQKNYSTRPYARSDAGYEEFRPAYRYGWESRVHHSGRDWTDVESELGENWDRVRGSSRLHWDEARQATRDAFQRPPHPILPDDFDEGRT